MKIKQPSIYYEEDANGLTSGLPFMNIQKGDNIPGVLFIAAAFDSDELVEGSENEVVKDVVFQSFYNSELLRNKLDEDTFDKVRVALGLK